MHRREFLPLLPAVVIAAGLELSVRAGWIPSFVFPLPSSVLTSLVDDRGEFARALTSTAIAAFAGLIVSIVIGGISAVLLSLSENLRRAFLPYAIFFQTVPVVAVAPVLVIWFGFGTPTVMASAFIVSIFPVIANTMFGLQSADPRLVDFFKLREATHFQTMWKLRIPAALPSFFSGIRIAAGLAVIGAIVGEFIAGGGLGEVVDSARTQQRLDKVFGAVLLSAVLGLLVTRLCDLASSCVLRNWSGGEN